MAQVQALLTLLSEYVSGTPRGCWRPWDDGRDGAEGAQ